MTKPRRPQRWICQHCPAAVTVYVELKYAPTHACSKRGSKVYGLELEAKGEEK
jgi:hypothetical protein